MGVKFMFILFYLTVIHINNMGDKSLLYLTVISTHPFITFYGLPEEVS